MFRFYCSSSRLIKPCLIKKHDLIKENKERKDFIKSHDSIQVVDIFVLNFLFLQGIVSHYWKELNLGVRHRSTTKIKKNSRKIYRKESLKISFNGEQKINFALFLHKPGAIFGVQLEIRTRNKIIKIKFRCCRF